MTKWAPHTWQAYPVTQAVDYKNRQQLELFLNKINTKQPLVTPHEVQALQQQLYQVAVGKQFILQGGDCAEAFTDNQLNTTARKVSLLVQMGALLSHELKQTVLPIGRIAGQYAKPRSELYETRGGLTLPSYRGDLINGQAFTLKHRLPCPKRLLTGYYQAAKTLKYLRTLTREEYDHLLRFIVPQFNENKDRAHFLSMPIYQRMDDALNEATTHRERYLQQLINTGIFTSHEALHLPYESALTHCFNDKWYNLSTHFPWVGMRTNAIDGAHLEYLRGIENPIAVKLGPETTPDLLEALIRHLDPEQIPGRLTLIPRFGVQKVEGCLPPLIQRTKQLNSPVIWSCDPMHGNTFITSGGFKTRQLEAICHEIRLTQQIHQRLASRLGGIHLEMTGEHVTECIGGVRGLKEEELRRAFKSPVDPRLNYEQALEVALTIASEMNASVATQKIS